jgi:CBS domain-containing protein
MVRPQEKIMPTVLDIMAKSPARCTPETPLGHVAKLMADFDCGAIPVVRSEEAPQPLGIITDRDIVIRLVAENRNPLEAPARDAMTEQVVTVRPDQSLQEVADAMEENQVRRIVVVDENGALVGIVSQADVALNAPREVIAEVLQEVSEDEDGDRDKLMPLQNNSYAG